MALAWVALALVLGAVVQGVVGLGIGLVAAPVTALAAPDLLPGTLISLALVLPLLTLIGEHRDIDWRGIGWAMPGRVCGTVVGVVVVARISERWLGIVVGVMVVLAVLLSWRAVRVPVTPRTLSVAGFVSGVTGTATSIGGPPFALLYQHRSAHQIRSTMAVFFVLGATLSLVGLGLSGELTAHQLWTVVLLAPAVLAGVLIAVPTRRLLSPALVRPAVLMVCGTSAVVLLVRSLLG